MLYLSDLDPNYQIKGSRDPLGFQSIWQKLGRNIIEHLSTVSSNLLDFRVMSYAYYLYDGDTSSNDFIDFFMRWEQACAYARECHDIDGGYNGKNFVSKKVRDSKNSSYSVSNSAADSILSNQKAYGIYGKYNRPFKEIGVNNKESFKTTMMSSFDKLKDKENNLIGKKIRAIAQKIQSNKFVKVSKKDLNKIAILLESNSKIESEFYEKYVLKGNKKHLQNQLHQLLEKNKGLLKKEFHFRTYINKLISTKTISDNLMTTLKKIIQTENVLIVYANIFRHIQSRSSWTMEEICKEEIVKNIPELKYEFKDQEIKKMAELTKNRIKRELINKVIEINNKVCVDRNNPPWLIRNDNKVEVHYQDGKWEMQEWGNIEEYYENNYFLAAYVSLYKQIKSI